MNFRKFLLTLASVLSVTSSLFAGYTINRIDGGNNLLLVQGREYAYLISNTDVPLNTNNVYINLSTPNYDIFVAPGFQVGQNEFLLDSNGQLVINIRFHNHGSYSLTVVDTQDSNNTGSLNPIVVQRYPVTYSVTPGNPSVNANQPFQINISALDATNTLVTAYEDPVQIVDSQMGQVTFVPGTSFVNGQATNVNVTVQAADINNHFDLGITMAGQQYYDPLLPPPSLVPPATVTLQNLTLTPGAFQKYVMLFPGEALTPGTGKTGTVTAQQSNVPVPLVRTYRVDPWFNPILVNPPAPLPLRFNSNRPIDTAFPVNIDMTGAFLDITAGMNLIYFNGAGTAAVTVEEVGLAGSTEEDVSVVPVDPGNAEFYEIAILNSNPPPGGSITTDNVIQAEIRAYITVGGAPQILTSLNGIVPGAQLRLHLGNGQESVNWVDTNSTDLIPQNSIVFSQGIAPLNLVATKVGSNSDLRFYTPTVSTISYTFNVLVGAPNKIHFSIIGVDPSPTQGQTWTPGTYPGNSGTPPTVSAGQNVVMEARITDRRWNLVSGGGPFTLQLVDNLPNHYLQYSHPQLSGPIYTFPSSGELKWNTDPAFDNAFRVLYRTAGPNGFMPSAPMAKGVSNLSTSFTCPSSINGEFCSSTATVTPSSYSKLALSAPGETLRPGIPSTTEPDGKTGVPTAQPAGVGFNSTAYATDQYYNPLINGPYPEINFIITPNLPGSFISGNLPIQMVSGSRGVTITLQQSSTVEILDDNAPAINQTVSIPVTSGPLHHFKMTTVASPQAAGVAFSATITAEDQYDNVVQSNFTVNLTPNTGTGTMSPVQVNLVNGVYSGNFTMFAATASAKITMSASAFPSATRESNGFAVTTHPAGYAKLLQLLPGEIIFPGTGSGKTGTPSPVTVGVVSVIKAISCDMYYNPLNTTGLVEFASDHYASFGSAQGNLINVDGHGEYSTTLILRTATNHSVYVKDVNNDATISRSTSVIQGLVGSYKKLQILAPGEVSDPGTFVPNGKTGALPLDQLVATPFNVAINAVDDFWNVVNFSGGDIVLSANPNNAIFNPPNNPFNGPTPRPFTNGVATREVIVGLEGLTTLSVLDQLNLTKQGQSVDVNVNPGPVYVIQAPTSTVAGQPFAPVTITLEDNGIPVVGYNESIYLTADLSSGGPATGAFNPDGSPRQYVMTNGSVTITDLTYAYCERIRIHLTDNFGRVSFSNDIDVNPSGLKYRITVPAVPVVAGPPASFDVMVELLEENTNTLVKNHDHEVGITVVSVVNPTTDGIYGVTSAQLSQGIATFQQTYSKAESIIIKATESATGGDPNYNIPPRNSNNVTVISDGYKKLLILAPGEIHVPGVPSATGKTGVPNNRQKAVPFLVQVRGVDQYWNVADQFNGGQILFTSDDIPPSISASNPINQNSPLINGEVAASIALFNPGNVNVTVVDSSNNGIGSQSVLLSVGGNYYSITVPAQEFSGPPTVFTMNATLIDFITGLPITTANNSITLEALHADGSPAAGNLGVTSANLVNGTVGITNQSYSIAENILIRVSDPNGDTGNSSIIQFIPRQIRYTFETPTDAEVNVPFQVTIKTIDQDTGTEVVNLNRTNSLAAYSSVTGLPATGNFSPNTVNIVNGVGLVSAIYDKAESIFLKMTDNTPPAGQSPPTQPEFNSPGSILVHPGPLASIDIADFNMQSNETKMFVLTCRDTYNNLTPNQLIGLQVISINLPGQIKLNGQVNALQSTTNGIGEVSVTFEPSLFANGVYQILLFDPTKPNGFSRVLNVTVLGFPEQPSGALGLGENRIPVNSTVFLDLNTQLPGGGTLETFYRVNGSQWFTYDPAVGIMAHDPARAIPFFDTTKEYFVEWYSQICYAVPCSNPVSELSVLGGPHSVSVITYQLDENLVGYPSPFNPKGASDENFITLQYPLAQASSVEIDIYDLFGQKVWHTDIPSGSQGGEARVDNRVFWFGVNDDGTTVANGGYIAVVKVGATGQKMRTKILVAK